MYDMKVVTVKKIIRWVFNRPESPSFNKHYTGTAITNSSCKERTRHFWGESGHQDPEVGTGNVEYNSCFFIHQFYHQEILDNRHCSSKIVDDKAITKTHVWNKYQKCLSTENQTLITCYFYSKVNRVSKSAYIYHCVVTSLNLKTHR